VAGLQARQRETAPTRSSPKPAISASMIAEGKKLTSLPGIDDRSSGYPSRPKTAPYSPISTAGNPNATAYHRGEARQRTIWRAQPRIEAPV
jgi:hypothetical protein